MGMGFLEQRDSFFWALARLDFFPKNNLDQIYRSKENANS
jgi:hypothetical protein